MPQKSGSKKATRPMMLLSTVMIGLMAFSISGCASDNTPPHPIYGWSPSLGRTVCVPGYPKSMLADEITGSAKVECDVDAMGKASNCKIDWTTGSKLFGESALLWVQECPDATHNPDGSPKLGHHDWTQHFNLKDR